MRIGIGFDVHTFKEGDFVILAGEKIPYTKSFLAHSDGDVVLHALTDAILGAAKCGDIGMLFPDTDPAYKNADSVILLQKAYEKVQTKGYTIGNIDITVMAERPKLMPHKEKMALNIAKALNIHEENVNVKATTMEKLGFVGREEGIAAQAIVLLKAIQE